MDEKSYKLYRYTRILIEINKKYCKDYLEDPNFQLLQSAIDHLDNLDSSYAERYEKEKQNLSQIES